MTPFVFLWVDEEWSTLELPARLGPPPPSVWWVPSVWLPPLLWLFFLLGALVAHCAHCLHLQYAHVASPAALQKEVWQSVVVMSPASPEAHFLDAAAAGATAAAADVQNEHALHLHRWQCVLEDPALQNGAHCAVLESPAKVEVQAAAVSAAVVTITYANISIMSDLIVTEAASCFAALHCCPLWLPVVRGPRVDNLLLIHVFSEILVQLSYMHIDDGGDLLRRRRW